MKTRKTLLKRIKITKSGKVLKKQNRTGHLKRKWNANKFHRKTGLEEMDTKGYIKQFKKMLGKHAKNVK